MAATVPIVGEDGSNNLIRRRRYIVNPGFQYKYTALLAGLGLLLAGGFGFFLFQAERENTALIMLDASMAEEVARIDARFIWTVVSFTVLLTLSLCAAGVVITHRMAGPLHLLTRYLNDLKRGELPNIRPLRSRDEFQQLFTEFAAAVEALKSGEFARRQALEECLIKLRETLRDQGDLRAALEEATTVIAREVARSEAALKL